MVAQVTVCFGLSFLFIFGPHFLFLTPFWQIDLICMALWSAYVYLKPDLLFFQPSKFISKIPPWIQLYESFRRWFSAENIYDKDLDPDGQYIFVVHPHGVWGSGVWVNYLPHCFGMINYFKRNMVMATLKLNFYIPLWRQYLISLGYFPAPYDCFTWRLREGHSVGCVIGGASEVSTLNQQRYTTIIHRRRGLFRMALEHGIPLVPVFNFGEIFVYNVHSFTGWDVIQAMVRQWTTVCPVLITGWYKTVIPNPVKITTVWGKPIHVTRVENPTDEDIKQIRDQYIRHLRQVFTKYKDVLGQGLDLEII